MGKGTPVLAALLLALLAAPVDHSPWDALLKAHVTETRLVDYDAFARSAEFRSYLAALEAARLEGWDERERLAFWINVYNAYTIEQVNRHGERESIRNIRRTLGLIPLKGPWSERMVRAAGRELTLDEVEHEIVRKEFQEPRIHFALVCAAVSCPPLRREAYAGDRLDAQLEEQTRRFLGDRERNRVDAGAGTVFVSPIFVWYRDDFGGSNEALGRYLARSWPQGPERDLLLSGRFRLRETDYDWRLNGVAKGAGPR
jgi:hypothetical protein